MRPSRTLLWHWAVLGPTVAIFLIAVAMRFVWLGSIPGMNGDEAWWGVAALRLVDGDTSWFLTPNQRVPNPFFLAASSFFHLVFSPSYWTLRLPAVASGIAAIALAYLLFRRMIGQSCALSFAFLMAVHPICIGYSRLAYDCSQTILASVLVLYLAFSNRIGWLALAILAALIIHPTNVLLVPIAAGILIGQHWYALKERPPRFVTLVFAAIAAVVMMCALLAVMAPSQLNKFTLKFFEQWQGLIGVGELLEGFASFLSGSLVFHKIAGSGFGGINRAFDGLLLVITLAPVSVALLKRQRIFSSTEVGLGCGILISFFLHYVLSGDQAFWGLRTRYVLFGIAPMLLFAVLSWARLACVSKGTAVAWLGLIGFAFSTSFYFNYFNFFWETGGRARVIYRTAPQEPKVAALDLIREHADGLGAEGEIIDVYPATFWEEWPLAYLAWNDQRIRVRSLTRGATLRSKRRLLDGAKSRYFVHYYGSRSSGVRNIAPEAISWTETIDDYGSKPTIVIVRIEGSTSL